MNLPLTVGVLARKESQLLYNEFLKLTFVSEKHMTGGSRQQVRLHQLCRALKEADPDIIDIIQFGSSVYAPDLARDIDLLITTHSKKDEDLYWDVFSELDVGVDVLVRTPGQPMGQDIATSVRLMGKVLIGDGETLKEAEAYMSVPTFDRARKSLETADTNLTAAQKSKDEILQDEYYKLAFNRLFDSARLAVMAFLNTENSRWGQLRKALPKPYNEQFRRIINTLHIQYSYDGNYPKDDPNGAFVQWRQKVERFIESLEQKAN
ncbi:nucleotidyltransferase domain-containing protein [candidate division KSB1 bacterium]|nr:nucleotidyltransferase domain-containing protein [candidate division KSB1 bacterium]NIR68711.1 nucleotidyltransferase domain-containing protein [candidate division KSB1 bacterium]NIS25528.1 nucleotidyltransferase domain-containing protein [candidate division KSB1 bacterium]NIT72421.1 nucleotidyltransferase domain-containing protein [candidate division KSB1 bacterium]NIU26205.1 nucleotidyltransferase domain-containing protein [candidate division KSB1 bacterium]